MVQLGDRTRRRSPAEIGVAVLLFLSFIGIIYWLLPDSSDTIDTNFCPQPAYIELKGSFDNSSKFLSKDYQKYSVQALQGAIQIPTESFDDMDLEPTKDSRFEIFKKLHEYLFVTFPLSAKSVEFVNTYGLLYTFEGSDPDLKPLVLMAHQDVVPVPESTIDQWDHPPFEGYFDGDWIYGRGVADTKDSLIGILEAIEDLLHQGWHPKRTVIVSFGFDEEIGGARGAQPLAEKLEERYGKDGIEAVIDEGFGMPSLYGSRVGAVTVSEKGYVDLVADLHTPGGHSSVPPDHTAIGIMSRLVKTLEEHPFPASLEDSNPTLALFRCLAEHSPRMNKQFRRTILEIDRADHRDQLAHFIDSNPLTKYLIRTSQAVDVIRGGVKLNALPERVELKVNHRVDPSIGVTNVLERFEQYVMDIAREFDLGVETHGETIFDRTPHGFFNISVARDLEPAPLSPSVGFPWDLLGSATWSVLHKYGFDEPIVMAPTLFPANTDTRYYWGLTRAIYRFKPVLTEDIANYHTVNERLRYRSHLITVAWYYELIINATV